MNAQPSLTIFLNGAPGSLTEVFDSISDTVFFVKDNDGRYVDVNTTLVNRCGLKSKDDLIGRRVDELFSEPFGRNYAEQDQDVLRCKCPVRSKLELHLYPGKKVGWCLTWKEPLFGANGRVVGLAGLSRDLPPHLPIDRAELGGVARALDYVSEHMEEGLSPDLLAGMAELSVYQLDKRIGEIFGLTTSQYIIRTRIEAARYKLTRSKEPISFIAHDCGYSDQSTFTRQFKRSVGITPNVYRKMYACANSPDLPPTKR